MLDNVKLFLDFATTARFRIKHVTGIGYFAQVKFSVLSDWKKLG